MLCFSYYPWGFAGVASADAVENQRNASIYQMQALQNASGSASFGSMIDARRELGDPRMPRPRNIDPKQRMTDEQVERFNRVGLLRAY